MSAATPDFIVRKQAQVAKDLLASLDMGVADDAELVADTIEGETDLHQALTEALAAIDECEVIEAGCKAKEEQYASRGAAAKARAERIRASIEQALVGLEIAEPLRLPEATLSLSHRKPAVQISDEALIPSRFFVEQPRPAPKLDKKALSAALAAGEAVPGASLDNGSISLNVRRK